jgi:hypothetical protein
MKIYTIGSKAAMVVGLFATSLVSSSQDQLSLRHGVYVRSETPCKDAPNAAIIVWDGSEFSGAHSSKCTSHVNHRDGSRFQISTSCLAQGDGSPNPSGLASVDSFLLNRLSLRSFQMLKSKQPDATYRWCSMK